MNLEAYWVKTENLLITESHLLIPMIWEGDLTLHSNQQLMQQSSFQTIILHGDTSLSIAISLMELHIGKRISYTGLLSKYKSFLCLNDKVYVKYQVDNQQIHFTLFKQNGVELLEGHLQGVEETS